MSSTIQLRRSHLVGAAVALALAGAAGQEASAADAQEAQNDGLAEVVVTGSRIARRDYESQSPIVTVEAGTFEERSSVGIESALNELPQFHVAGNAQANSTARTAFPSATAAPGAATANLRGLGTNRTLVLVDGRRVQPVNGALVVDLNTIPSAAIQSVEVISGGAAAVYGADAISGVVNLILKKDFQGAQIDAQYGITQEGDGREEQFSVLLGTNYAEGRGNVMLGATWSDRGEIKGQDRSWVRKGWLDPGTSTGSYPYLGNLSAFNCGCGTMVDPALKATFPLSKSGSIYVLDQNGHLFDPGDPLNPAHPYTGPLGYDSGYKINPNGNLTWIDKEHSYLSVPLERYALFGSSHYDVTDNIELFTDVRFSETKSTGYGFQTALYDIWGVSVPYNPLYDDPDSPQFGGGPLGTAHHPVPRELADMLNLRANPNANWQYEGTVDYLPPYRTDTTSDVFQMIGGLRGKLPFSFTRDWTWEVYGSHGKSSVNARLPEGFLYLPRVTELFEADQYGAGWQNGFPIAVFGSCTSGLPIFNPDGSSNDATSISKDCADYITLRMNNVSTLAQDVVEANVQGSLFDIWGGTVKFAAGSDYRSEHFQFEPDSGYNGNQSFPNVTENIALPTGVDGRTDVKEVYAELSIPLVKDLPFVRRFEIDPGYRLSDYKVGGNVSTYKILGDWMIEDWIRLRGGFQRANRAPNVTELFTPVGASSIESNAADACGNWPGSTPDWGNVATNPNRHNLQLLCQYLMVRDGAPPSLYEPGGSADTWAYNAFGLTYFYPSDLAVQGGNPNLKSETADTWTGGIVLRSPFDAEALRRLSLSVDYYEIGIKGAIATPSHLTVYQQCMDAQYNSLIGDAPGSHTGAEIAANNPYCDLIQREYYGINVFGADRKFKATYVNLGGIKTKGVDVQLDWGAQFADMGLAAIPGAFTANIQYSYLDSYAISPFPGSPYVEYKGTTTNSSFKYRLFSTFGYSVGPVSVGLRWEHLPGLEQPTGASPDLLPISSHNQYDLFGRWSIGEKYEVRGGIDNLFNAEPETVGARLNANPAQSNNAYGSTNSNYDTFGRRFYIAAKVKF